MQLRWCSVCFLTLILLSVYGCSGSDSPELPTGTSASNEVASQEVSGDSPEGGELSAAALSDEDAVRGRASIQIRGTIVDSENNVAQVSFHGTTRSGRPIQGHGKMKFRTVEDAEGDSSRGRIRFRGTIGTKPVRGVARFRGILRQDGDSIHGRGGIRFIVELLVPSE